MQQFFILPAGHTKEAFNTTSLVKGTAVSNYEVDGTKNLADVETTLGALAIPGFENYNRSALYPRDIESFILEPLKTDEEHTIYQIVEGNSEIHGFGFVVMQVAGPGGKPANLYAVEDQDRSCMVVVGPSAIDEGFRAELLKNGVHYVARTEKDAAIKVNDFLVEGARWRGRNGRMETEMASYMIENLIKAIAVTCSLPSFGVDPGDGTKIIPCDATVGGVLTKLGDEEAAAYTKIRKPKLPAFANLPP